MSIDLEMLDLYTDYLICSISYTTAIGLSRVTDGVVSHDKVTRFLSAKYFTSSDDIELSNEQIAAIYKKRWRVETYHQSLKHNSSLAKSPTQKKMTQTNHFFASVCAFIKLEKLSVIKNTNHFALKQKIYIRALMTAMYELAKLKPVEFNSSSYYLLKPA